MRSSDTEDNVSRQELRTLQRVLRTRASNLKKKAKRHGLIRPLSQIDTGSQDVCPSGLMILFLDCQLIRRLRLSGHRGVSCNMPAKWAETCSTLSIHN